MDKNTLKTTAFWATIAAQVANGLLALQGFVDARYALPIATGVAVLYYISRTITKYNAEFKRGWMTTEFWITVLVIAGGAVAAAEDAVPGTQFAALATLLAGVLAVSRALVNPSFAPKPPVDPEAQ
jgi:hypothetical protein